MYLMELKGKKIAILVDDMYQEMEIWYPLYRLTEAGAECVLVGAKAGQTYTSKLGYPATAQKSYDEVSAKDFDGIVVPGGFAPDLIRRYPRANQLVKDLNDQKKLVAAICHGKAYFTTPYTLGQYVLMDYMDKKTRTIH